jgi:hypothetical protein
VHQLMSEAGPLIKGGEKGAVKLVGNPLARLCPPLHVIFTRRALKWRLEKQFKLLQAEDVRDRA